MLEVLFNDTQRKIIDLLLQKGSCSLSELTEIISLSKPAVFRQVKALVAAEVANENLESTIKGREARYSLKHFSIFYTINPERKSVVKILSNSKFHPAQILLEQVAQADFKEDLKIFVDAIDEIATDIGITAVVLFGSVAEGKGRWKSDIDVAVIAARWDKESEGIVRELQADACLSTKYLVRPFFLSEERLEKEDSVIANEIRSSGIVVYASRVESDAVWRGLMRYKSTMR